VSSLNQQIADLQEAVNHLNAALKSEEEKYKEQELEITNLHDRLEGALSKKLAELQALRQELEEVQGQNVTLKDKVGDLSKAVEKGRGKIGQFQSDFLAKLAEIVGDRQDLRVVGDRFIFQSEVLFDRGSADLGIEGQKQLDKLATALKEIAEKIPSSVPWVLRVDGHTDQLPIKTSHFPSNWELSSARAISVVRYLISQGINPKNLVAAGFGEFQPLGETREADSMARDRRIEFKLDQR
jgi:chemotaxis protein MotB